MKEENVSVSTESKIEPEPEKDTQAAQLRSLLDDDLRRLHHASKVLENFLKKRKQGKAMVKNALNKFHEMNSAHDALVEHYSDWEIVCGI